MLLSHPKQVLVAKLYFPGSVVTPPPEQVQVLQPKLPPGVFQQSPFPAQMKPEPFPEQGQQQALSSQQGPGRVRQPVQMSRHRKSPLAARLLSAQM